MSTKNRKVLIKYIICRYLCTISIYAVGISSTIFTSGARPTVITATKSRPFTKSLHQVTSLKKVCASFTSNVISSHKLLNLIVDLILRISNHLPFYIELHSNVPCKMFLGNHFCNCILTALCNIHLLLNNQVEGCSHHMSDPSILCDIFTKDVSQRKNICKTNLSLNEFIDNIQKLQNYYLQSPGSVQYPCLPHVFRHNAAKYEQ